MGSDNIKKKKSTVMIGITLITLVFCFDWYTNFLLFIGIIFLINAVTKEPEVPELLDKKQQDE